MGRFPVALLVVYHRNKLRPLRAQSGRARHQQSVGCRVYTSPKLSPYLEPLQISLFGYLLLAKKCYQMKKVNFKSWNFSQKNKKIIKVIDLIYELNKHFLIKVKHNPKNKSKSKKEKKYLNLSSYRSNKFLKWKAIYNTQNTISQIVEWESFFKKHKKVDFICKKQIKKYFNKLKLN